MAAKKSLVGAAAFAAAVSVLTTVGARAASPYSWASGLAGCDPSRPAVAHHADQHLLPVQPTDGPVPCGMLTGYPTVETRIEVTDAGKVVYEPALQGGPILGGDGHVPGWGNGLSVAVTSNQGSTWAPVSLHVWPVPEPVETDGQVDNNLYADHGTGRLFWYMYNSGPSPGQIPYGCGGGGGGTVAFSDDTTSWSWAFDRDHDCSENPTILTAKPRVPGEQLAYPNVVYLCGDNASTGVVGTGNPGFSCSKSLTGGTHWIGTTLDSPPTLNPQGFYSGPLKDLLDPYAQCAGSSSSAGADVQPLPDGTLLVVVSCNNKTYLSESKDEGATWKIVYPLRHGGELRTDSAANIYLLENPTASKLLLSHSTDGGKTWSSALNMIAPGVTSVGTFQFAQGTYAAGQVGHVAVTYYGNRTGKTASDGFITETRDGLDASPVFWSGQVNSPTRPLLYNTTGADMGITVLDFNGGALSPDGRSAWGSWVQDCGTNLATDPHCQSRWGSINPGDPQDGFAGRLVWPAKA
ncbi:MAG: sialidase family protein [Acidimicrobiales bacterium]